MDSKTSSVAVSQGPAGRRLFRVGLLLAAIALAAMLFPLRRASESPRPAGLVKKIVLLIALSIRGG